MNKDCCLCSQISSDRAGDLISQLLDDPDYVRRIPLESSEFVVVPSLGPIAAGHSLICTRRHAPSIFNYLNSVRHRQTSAGRLDAIIRTLSNALEELFGMPVHLFEHGPSPNKNRSICTVDHAHLHLLPAAVEIVDRLKTDSRWKSIAEDWVEASGIVGEAEYLYYQSPGGEALAAIGGSFESQYLRRVFATELGREEAWDWRAQPDPSAADSLFRQLQAVIPPTGPG